MTTDNFSLFSCNAYKSADFADYCVYCLISDNVCADFKKHLKSVLK